jgi:hypothetical protein
MADLTKLPQVPAGCAPAGVTDQRGKDAFLCRFGTATTESIKTADLAQSPNTDEAHYADKSGTYSKGLLQDSYGVVNPAVFKAFRDALSTGTPLQIGEFSVPAIKLGGNRTLNGPRGAFARTLSGTDSQNIGSPLILAAPEVMAAIYCPRRSLKDPQPIHPTRPAMVRLQGHALRCSSSFIMVMRLSQTQWCCPATGCRKPVTRAQMRPR